MSHQTAITNFEQEDRGAQEAQDVHSEQPVDIKQEVLKGLGGTLGMIYSVLPVVVFAMAVPFLSLLAAIGSAVAVARVLGGYRFRRGEQVIAAVGGVFGVAVAGGVSAATGSANDFFLIGIWASLVGAVILLMTLVVRRPLTGVIWNALHGGENPWRDERGVLLVHDLATFAVMVMLAGRFAVRQWLYMADSTTWLAVADTVTGFPLTAVGAVVIVWAFRRSTKRLLKNDTAQTATDPTSAQG